MSKPPDKQITEVGSRSAGDAVKAAEQNAEAYWLCSGIHVKQVEETARLQPDQLISQGRNPTAAKGSWSRFIFEGA